MDHSDKKDQPRKQAITIGLSFLLLATTITCQVLIFESNWKDIGLSILIGTCGTLAGGFAALLASPYGAKDEERLSKVGAIILTLLTGWLLGKVIDPLVTAAIAKPEVILQPKNAANVLIGLIGLLGGFINTYEFRAFSLGSKDDTHPGTPAPVSGGQPTAAQAAPPPPLDADTA